MFYFTCDRSFAGTSCRPGRARKTCKTGTVNSVPLLKLGRKKRRFSVPLLIILCHQIDLRKSGLNIKLFEMRIFTKFSPYSTNLRLHFHKFPVVALPDPHNREGVSPLPNYPPFPSALVHRHTGSEFWGYRGGCPTAVQAALSGS